MYFLDNGYEKSVYEAKKESVGASRVGRSGKPRANYAK